MLLGYVEGAGFAVSAVGMLAVVAAILAVWMFISDVIRPTFKPPNVGRRMKLKAPKTRPMIVGQWERSIKKEKDESPR